MNRLTTKYQLTVLSLLVVPVIFGCIHFLDEPLAIRIMQLIRSVTLLRRSTANIPDILLLLVCGATAGMWLAYFYLSRRGDRRQLPQCLQVTATSLPVAYVLKSLLQYTFGRTNTRLWLDGLGPLEFSWFHGSGIGCFPSGHMTVFTTLFVAICCYYPRFNRPAAGLLLLLGTALVATDYHFLSDVIAGAYLGILVVAATRHCLAKTGLAGHCPDSSETMTA